MSKSEMILIVTTIILINKNMVGYTCCDLWFWKWSCDTTL